MSVAVRCH